jgi:signal transduction histidine kinase
MKFRTLLVIGIGALVVVTLFCGVMAAMTLHVTTKSAERVTNRVVTDLEALHEVRLRAEQLVAAGRGLLLTGDESERNQLARVQADLDHSLDELRARNRNELGPRIAILEQAALEYARAVVVAVDNKSLREPDLTPSRSKLESAMDDLTDREQDDLTNASAQAGRVVRAVGITTLVGCLLGVAIGVVLAVFVSRRLTGQYEREQAAAYSRKELLDIVSHDLRSPLNSIVLGLEIVKEGRITDRTVSIIAQSAERMQRLVNDLLDASRAELAQLELNLEAIEPRVICEQTRMQFEDLARAAGLTYETNCAATGRVECDRQRITQILSNLIGNAIKFTKAGDSIGLEVTGDTERVRFSVRDRGPGIPQAEQALMFEAYRQGSQTSHRGGIGLGLYICKKLVEAHGGTLGVSSAAGEGSTFWFELPRTQRAKATAGRR